MIIRDVFNHDDFFENASFTKTIVLVKEAFLIVVDVVFLAHLKHFMEENFNISCADSPSESHIIYRHENGRIVYMCAFSSTGIFFYLRNGATDGDKDLYFKIKELLNDLDLDWEV